MPELRFDTYYRYDDLTRLLQGFAAEYPQLARLDSIGKSYEGREVWLMTVTNFATGEAKEKPALWVDGNIHASEVAPSSACLYLIDKLIKDYGTNPEVTRCLDTRAFYLCPRVNPDGAEWALADKPKIIRSSTRPYPYDEEPIEGLHREDIDGDGRMLSMRLPDPNGPWKVCPEEPRLLVRRDPAETGGQYYRVLPEGLTLENGKLRHELGQLEGRAYKDSAVTIWHADSTSDRAKVEWTVRAPNGGVVKLTARHERAGMARAEVELKKD